MLSSTINNLVQILKPRQRDILSGRFGLKDGEKKTLAELGEEYGITRERTRQIEAEALDIVKDYFNKEKSIRKSVNLAQKHLGGLGGVRKDEILLDELKSILDDADLHHWHLRLVSEVVGEIFYYLPDENFHGFWHLGEDHYKKADNFLSKLENLINERKEELFREKKFDSYFAKAARASRIPEEAGTNYISISKKFGVNPFGDVGLSHWEEINPKTIRGKAYLVLKKKGEPVHFRDISSLINEAMFDERKAYPQTVHNELIKDPRFVLVGRGIYGLTEHGFNPGATYEIISGILRQKGPMPFRDIVSSVKNQRFLKDNTILLNLQNKKYFKKLPDGRYSLVK
jgi:hypothetical protein